MDIRNVLTKLDNLTEGTMTSAKKKPTGPKFVGQLKGTDPASKVKDKYVGGEGKENMLASLEKELKETESQRKLGKEFDEFKEAYDHNAPFNAADFNRHMEQLRAREELRKTDPMKALVGDLIDKEHEKERLAKRKPAADDSMSINDPRHPGFAYTEFGHHKVAEGDVVQFPKKHKGDLSSTHNCPKCGGDLQGGKYMGHEVKVCMPCKQVYLPPNSGIDQHGNKIKEGYNDEEQQIQNDTAVEAYGYAYNKRDQRVMWRKEFSSQEAAYKWADSKNATVIGIRPAVQSMGESANPTDTVTMDIPLMIRMFEYAREDAKTDMDLHGVATRMIELSKNGQTLTMDNYATIMGQQQNEGREFTALEVAIMEGGGSLPDELGYQNLHPTIVKARHKFPLAKSDVEALVLYIGDKEEDDVTALGQQNDREDAEINQLDHEEDQIQAKLVALSAQLKQLHSAMAARKGVKEAATATPAPPVQPNKPALGADMTKPAGQQDPAQAQAAAQAAQQEKAEQATLQKGVNDLKAAGAAVTNPTQVVKAFDKVDNQQALTPAEKNNMASAGTVLAPIMSNPQLQGKFKDLVNQASTAEKLQQQKQAAQPVQPVGAVGAPQPGQVK